MTSSKARFALFFGNRGFFPALHLEKARSEMTEVLNKLGHEVLLLGAKATRYGGVETPDEGRIYAQFLDENRGKYDGIIVCLPNFGDENGATAALHKADVPIFIHAYPDDMDKLAKEYRRDAFCGKISIMDVFKQQDIKFTVLKPHVVAPRSEAFAANIDYFGRLCRVVAGMKDMRVGAFGARTTAFKTVRIDELALQRKGVTVETYDLASIIGQIQQVDVKSERYVQKAKFLRDYSSWNGVPEEAFVTIAKMGSVFDEIIERDHLDCVALRCWIELQMQLRVSPCVLMSDMNDRGIAAACEVDIGSAVTMRALHLAAGAAPSCLDWNNNYYDDPEKCIVFHCGPVPQSMMREKGEIQDHQILATVLGNNCSYGCNVGRMRATPVTYGNLSSEDGRLKMYLGEGELTDDVVPKEFFGTAGVVKIPGLQDVLYTIGNEGFRHHVGLVAGQVKAPLQEALGKYLGYELTMF